MKLRKIKGYTILGWYEWGNEDSGFVSVWGINDDNCVLSLGSVKKESLDPKIPYGCPWT